jgi:hypothetical protein
MKTRAMTMMLALGLGAMSVGCDDDTTSNGGGPDMAASMFPAAPAIATTQLDRMGRAGVNTALTDPFYTDKTAHEAKQDAYNKAPEAMWPTFTAQFAASLGILDGLDGICGNQPLAVPDGADGGSAGEYGALAGILANDQLLLDTRVATCDPATNYLAVEVGVITGAAPGSCGGRTPLDHAINVTYAAASGGLLSGVAVTDGTTADADTGATAQLTTFPFLGAPLQ